MRIGELTRHSGVPATAVRYYEQVGILHPPRRSASGYRAYDADVLPRLRFVRAAQAVGLSLAEIGEILRIRDRGNAPCEHVVALIEHRRAEVAARIRELKQLQRDLTVLGTRGEAITPANCDASGVCEVISLDTTAGKGADATLAASPPRAF